MVKKIRLVEACLKIGSGATPRGGKNVYCEKGISLIRSQNVLDFDFSENGLVYINEEQASKLNNVEVMEGDVLLNITGDSVARATIMKSDFLPARVNQHVAIIRAKKEIIDPLYLLYFLQYQKSYLLQLASAGATRNALTKSMIAGIELELPSLDIQRKIVSILNDIQEKILENKKINENLEHQIETILLKTIDNASTQSVKLGDYLYIKGRIGWKGLKKSEYLPVSGYRIINGESLTLSGIDWNKAGYISAERYEESPEIMLNIGDILLSKDGTIGKIGYVDKLETPTSVASGIFVIRNTRQAEISTQFIYYLLKSRLFKVFITSRTEGSVIPHLYQKDFMEFEFQLPSPDDMRIFDNSTSAMFSMLFSNLSENERLIRIRDSLLPKLMSGEIDVSALDF